MNRSNCRDSPNVSISSSNGVSKTSNIGNSLMNESGQILHRRSPIQQTQQPQSFDTLGSPSTTSFTFDEISETANSIEDDSLNIRIDQLQRQIESLTEIQTTQDERYKRSRQENDALLNRIHGLEDQVRELELNADSRSREEERRYKEAMAKQTQKHSQECEQHLHANFLLQQEVFKLKSDLLKSDSLVRTLRSEKDALEAELQDKNSELQSLDEEIHKLKLVVKHLKDEESVKSNIISLLNEELEDSHNRSQREHQQQYNNEQSTSSQQFNQSPKHISPSSRRSSVTSGYGEDFSSNLNNKALKDIDGLEMSLMRVREENKRLKENNEELQAQLLNFQLEEGRSLVREGDKTYSLADELGDIDVQRLMKALKEQQDDNARLRKYIDEILLRIVESNPEILDTTISSRGKSQEPVRENTEK